MHIGIALNYHHFFLNRVHKTLWEIIIPVSYTHLAKDGEGASKLLECTCAGAPDLDTAIIVAKSVIRSPLLKLSLIHI